MNAAREEKENDKERSKTARREAGVGAAKTRVLRRKGPPGPLTRPGASPLLIFTGRLMASSAPPSSY